MREEEISNSQTPKFMRAKELSKHLSIALSTVWLYAKQGRITPLKLSSNVTVFNVEATEKALFGEVA